MSGGPVSILLVEDNAADVFFVREALRSEGIDTDLIVAQDGEKAVEFIKSAEDSRDAPCPQVILLDLNLPGMDGREVLAEIKADPSLAIIPVVILTTSSAEQDILRTYQLHANCFITKPVDFQQFIRVVQSIEEFWFSIVRLAPNEGQA